MGEARAVRSAAGRRPTPEIELRQMFELEDFPDVPPEVAKQEESFKAGRDRP